MQDNFMSIRCDFVTSSDYKTAVTRRDPCPRGPGIQQLGQMFFLKTWCSCLSRHLAAAGVAPTDGQLFTLAL